MASRATAFPECCRYCPHRTSVKGSCNHDAAQSLMQAFAEADGADRPCPVYDDIRAGAMAQLSERLDGGERGPSK